MQLISGLYPEIAENTNTSEEQMQTHKKQLPANRFLSAVGKLSSI